MIKVRRNIQFEHGLRQIEITPLIDIVFLLLIFFMLTSQFVIQMGFPVKLPKAATSKLLKSAGFTVVISEEGALYYQAHPITLKDLKNLLKKIKPSRVFIKADKNSRLSAIVKVWDVCRDTGVEKIHIATQK